MIEVVKTVIQIIIPLGILNVWFFRNGKRTTYRGKNAENLKAEFKAYGLSDSVFYVVGFLKITSAVFLLIGLFVPVVVAPAAATMAFLMLGAVLMHAKVSDPLVRYLPAGLMLGMSLALLL